MIPAALVLLSSILVAQQPLDAVAEPVPVPVPMGTVDDIDGRSRTPALLAGLVVIGVAAAGGLGFAWRRRRRHRARLAWHDDATDVQLFVPPGLARRAALGGPPMPEQPWAGTLLMPVPQAPAPDPAPAPAPAQPPPAPLDPVPASGPPVTRIQGSAQRIAGPAAGPLPAPWSGSAALAAAAQPQPVQEVQIGPVHFHPPPEGTLQVLPGRLEVLSGSGATGEIRFIRLPGREPVVTFGRSEGEPHTHVRLEALTVSRVHAAMQFTSGCWHLENRSRTNPVVVNGAPMPLIGGTPVRLTDGDIVEMGEVSFRFRDR
jgi:hypothetical protein